MKIAIDLDDTLSVVDRVTRASQYIMRNDLPFKLVDEHAHTLVDVFDWEIDDVMQFVRDGGITVFTEAEARKGAREVLTALRAAGHKIVVLTARQKNWFTNPERVTRDWLEKRHIPYDEIVAEIPFAQKGRYCVENHIPILIEDKLEACLKAQELGVHAILMIGENNSDRAKEVRYGGSNWKQIAAILNALIPRI